MEEQENLTPSQMLTLIQRLLVNNTREIENLESAVTELDLSRDKSKDDLNSHYDRVCTMLNEVYKSSMEEVATQHDKMKEDLKRKKKRLTRSSLALVPELANLRSDGTDAYDAMRRCKQILAKLAEDVDLEKIDARVSFNFIPKIGKLKLGFLQLCNNLPQDFTLRLLTPIKNIRLGQQIRCGIEGNFTAENVRHLEFGIRRDNDFVPTFNLGTEGKVFNFGFTADLGGVYVILACLFGNPIAHSPLTLTIHESGPRLTNEDVLASHIEVSADAIGLKDSEEEDDADKISSSVQDAGSVKASTKVVEGNDEKSSSMALEKSKPYQQIKDDRNTDFNRNRKESMIDGQDGQARINNNELPGGRFKIGDSCVALGKDGIWYNGLIEASNSDGSFLIKFIDYGNSDNVALADIVKSAPDIPDDVPDYDVDDHVGSRAAGKVLKGTTFGKNGKENSVQDLKKSNEDLYSNKNVDTSLITKEAEKVHYIHSENKAFEVGDACVAQWSEDQVWYNGIVQSISKDGSYSVTFTDFGNTDYVNHPFIVKETSAIPPGEYVDENVKNTLVTSKSNDRKENNETLEQSPPTDENVNEKCPDSNKDTSKKNSSVPDEHTSSSHKAAVPFITKTVIPQCDSFGDIGDENDSKVSREKAEHIKTEESLNGALNKKRRNKSKPPAPRPLESKSKPPEPRPLESKSKPPAPRPLESKSKPPEPRPLESKSKPPETRSIQSKSKPPEPRPLESKSKPPVPRSLESKSKPPVPRSLESKSKPPEPRPLESKSKPPVPRSLESSFVNQENVTAMLPKAEGTCWKAGDVCLAQWSEDGVWYNAVIDNKKRHFSHDGSSQVTYNVTFTDYGNKDQVRASQIVKDHNELIKSGIDVIFDGNVNVDLPSSADAKRLWNIGETCLAKNKAGMWCNARIEKLNSNGLFTVRFNHNDCEVEVDLQSLAKTPIDVLDINQRIIDKNVKLERDTLEASKSYEKKDVMINYVVGEVGIAKWKKDDIWYRAKIENVNVDGSLDVLFIDYGNTDVVKMPCFVKNTSMIEETGEEIFLDHNIEVHVEEDPVGNNEFYINSKSPSSFPLPLTNSNTPVDVNGEFIYPNIVEGKAFPSSKTEKTIEKSLTQTSSSGSTFSSGRTAFKKDQTTRIKLFNILQHVTKSKDGGQELVVKCILKISENLHSPIGITVLPNKSIAIGSNVDDSAKILRPDGTNWAPISSVRHFVKPTDMVTLSTGEFVVRDDLGLQLFTEQGEYIKSLATKQIDKCFGLAEDEDGNIIVINWVQPSRSSKPGSKGIGGLTDVGETDVFFISRESGKVLKRIELTDIISDKTKSKCRFLRYHKNTLYIVDNGLDCIYKLKTDGNEVSVIEGTGTKKFCGPSGIVVDDFGNFIVADSKNHRLQVFDREENFIGFVAVDVPIRRPSGIFLDKELGELYVLNYWGIYPMVKYRPGLVAENPNL